VFCSIRSYNTCSSALCRHLHRPTIVLSLALFIALPMMRCSKSAQKSAVQVCQVATVVIIIINNDNVTTISKAP